MTSRDLFERNMAIIAAAIMNKESSWSAQAVVNDALEILGYISEKADRRFNPDGSDKYGLDGPEK